MLALLSAWVQADNTHGQRGPVGEWLSNGKTRLKVWKVTTVESLTDYQKLAWKSSFTGKQRDQHFDFLERQVFAKGGTVALVDFGLENSLGQTMRFGHQAPMWTLRLDDGQQLRFKGVHQQLAARELQGGMPPEVTLKNGQKTRQTIAFFLPKERSPRAFYFDAPSVMETKFGAGESLVCVLSKGSSASSTLADNLKQDWQSNDLWKMRLLGMHLVKDAQAYAGLPWNDRLSAAEREKHVDYVKRNVFAKGGQVVLLKLEAKNLTDSRQAFGFTTPFWRLRCNRDQELALNGVYQQTLPWALEGGMPKATSLNPKATAAGWMGFFLPAGHDPQSLTFEAKGSLANRYGEPLLFRLP